jgi:hypothetical protein
MKIPDITKFPRMIKKHEQQKTYVTAFCEDKEFCQGMQSMAEKYKIPNPCAICTQLVMEKLYRLEQEQEDFFNPARRDEYLS